jgi:hypothetical protein
VNFLCGNGPAHGLEQLSKGDTIFYCCLFVICTVYPVLEDISFNVDDLEVCKRIVVTEVTLVNQMYT